MSAGDLRPLPWLGPPRDEWALYVCGYAPEPGGLHCNRDATWHGLVLDDPAEHIAAMMESCDDHLPQMKLSADYVHPITHPCCIPGSRFRWPENECYTDWDGSELLGRAEQIAEVSR